MVNAKVVLTHEDGSETQQVCVAMREGEAIIRCNPRTPPARDVSRDQTESAPERRARCLPLRASSVAAMRLLKACIWLKADTCPDTQLELLPLNHEPRRPAGRSSRPSGRNDIEAGGPEARHFQGNLLAPP